MRTTTSRLTRHFTLVATTAALAIVAALAPADARGQDRQAETPPQSREGVHFSIGLGTGSASVSCRGCQTNFLDDRLAGVSGVMQLGGFLNPQLALTGEIMGWMKNDDPIFRRVASWGITLLGYPDPNTGFFVKGSFGGLRAIGENDLVRVKSDAWMATTGIGYDIPVGDGVYATLYANYVRAFGTGTEINGILTDVAATPNLLQIGVGLTVH